MTDLAGAVVWAVVPFVPEAPFRLYAGEAHTPVEVADAGKLITAARKGSDSEFTFLVPGKSRPVLVVSDRLDPRLRSCSPSGCCDSTAWVLASERSCGRETSPASSTSTPTASSSRMKTRR